MLNKFLKVDLEAKNRLNAKVIANYSKLKPSLFILPLFFLGAIVLFLYYRGALHVDQYIQIQKNSFIFLNSKLSEFPTIIVNLTQLGDELVLLSILSFFILCAPKIWESLVVASLVSCLTSTSLKTIFAIPRPAAVFDNNSFVIVGKALTGHSSLPSGHSITALTVLTVLLFAFLPKKKNYRILWFVFIISMGLILVFTRVGIGAHYPLDVVIGGIIGYISGLLGIFINEKYKIWTWVKPKKHYPIFILFFLICGITIIDRILNENLFIYYLALTSLLFSIYKIIQIYAVKK